MDKDKDDRSIVGKTVDAVKEFAATVSEAAQKAIKPEPVKSDDEPTLEPAAPTGFMDDAVTPATPVIIRTRKPGKSRAKANKTRVKKAKSPKKPAKKSAKKAKTLSVRKPVAKAKTRANKRKTKKSKR